MGLVDDVGVVHPEAGVVRVLVRGVRAGRFQREAQRTPDDCVSCLFLLLAA